MPEQRRAWRSNALSLRKCITGLLILYCITHILLAITPSSYALALQLAGQEVKGLFLGTPRAIRSDEWMVLTPYYQIVVNNDFLMTNSLSPYQENLRSFQALPILDWGLIFKPYHWGFFVLPPANALSLYYLFMTLSFLAGWGILFRQFRLPLSISLLLAGTLYFSPMIQTWWTTNLGSFSLAPWWILSWILIENRVLRVSLTAYAIAVWTLANAYPPFLYSIGFAMVALTVCIRTDKLNAKRVVDGLLALAAALGIFIFYFGDLIAIMRNTVYPGHRVSTSGGIGWPRMIAHLFPGVTTHSYEPLPGIPNSNAAEITVLSTFLPALTLALIDYSRLHTIIREKPLKTLAFSVFFFFISCWLLLYIPPALAKLTGLSMVPTGRAVLAFGLMLNIICAVSLARAGIRISGLRLLILAAILFTGTILKLVVSGATETELYGYMDAIPYACMALLAGLWLSRTSRPSTPLLAVFFVAFASNALTYGLFNPVQSAYLIFNNDRAATRQHMANLGAIVTNKGDIAVPGHFGAILEGMGFRTLNHVLYAPQLDYFRKIYGNMDESSFTQTFNRYAHISIGNVTKPTLIAPDHVQLPISSFSGRSLLSGAQSPSPMVEILDSPPEGLEQIDRHGHIDSVSRPTDDRNTLDLTGWIHARSDSSTKVRVWSSNPIREVEISSHSRVDVAQAVSQELANSGIRLRLHFRAPPSPEDRICIEIQDGEGIFSTVLFMNADHGCITLGRNS